LKEIKAASVEELASVEGMNKTAAENVYYFFRLEKSEKQNRITQ